MWCTILLSRRTRQLPSFWLDLAGGTLAWYGAIHFMPHKLPLGGNGRCRFETPRLAAEESLGGWEASEKGARATQFLLPPIWRIGVGGAGWGEGWDEG